MSWTPLRRPELRLALIWIRLLHLFRYLRRRHRSLTVWLCVRRSLNLNLCVWRQQRCRLVDTLSTRCPNLNQHLLRPLLSRLRLRLRLWLRLQPLLPRQQQAFHSPVLWTCLPASLTPSRLHLLRQCPCFLKTTLLYPAWRCQLPRLRNCVVSWGSGSPPCLRRRLAWMTWPCTRRRLPMMTTMHCSGMLQSPCRA